jgi:3-oxoacyl-[acyl-carrier-protein] synthase II
MRDPVRRVVVTGCGALAGGAGSVEEIWEALLEDRMVAGGQPTLEHLSELAELPTADASILGRHQLLALAAVRMAWKNAGLPPEHNRLRGEGAKQRFGHFGCVSGTSTGGLVAMEEEVAERSRKRFSPYSLTRWRSNAIGSAVSVAFGLGGSDFSLNAASATGAQCVLLAGTLIRAGTIDAAVVVAADPLPGPLLREAMERNGSIAKTPEGRPLGSARSGMHPREGAGCVILESGDHAQHRGAVPLAEWTGGDTAAEAFHLMAPDPKADALGDLLRRSLGASPHGPVGGVDWVSLHATGTPRFDAVEIACLKRFFGETFPWITAVKRTTGHCLAASGVLEAAMLAQGLFIGSVPAWPGKVDPALGLAKCRPAVPPLPRHAVQIGQGMGGVVVVNVFSRCGR